MSGDYEVGISVQPHDRDAGYGFLRLIASRLEGDGKAFLLEQIEATKESGVGFFFDFPIKASWNGYKGYGGEFCEIDVEGDFSFGGFINADEWGMTNFFHSLASQFYGIIKLSIVETNYKVPSADWATEKGGVCNTTEEIIDAHELELPTNTWELIEKEYQAALEEISKEWAIKKEVEQVKDIAPDWTAYYDRIENLSSVLADIEEDGGACIEELLFHELGSKFHDRLRAIPPEEVTASWWKDREEQAKALEE